MKLTGRYLEDFAVGQTFRSGRLEIDKERIKTFGAEFDPQPFHLDEDAARDTIFGGLAASGWHTAAVTMRLLVESDLKPAGGIVGAGADEFRWPRPVRAGDELRIESEVLEVRPSRSRPDQGLIKVRTTTLNQHDEAVQIIIANLVVRRRPTQRGVETNITELVDRANKPLAAILIQIAAVSDHEESASRVDIPITKEKSMSNSPSQGTALITGASTGIGAVYADRLAKRNYDLILVARNEARLKALAARLTSETGRSVTPLPVDLSDTPDLERVETILRDDQTITMLVNNAGVASVAPLLNAGVEKMDDIIALNITALTHLTYAVAPAFVARGAGTIINIASVVGISPETLNGVYGASKAYVLALSHSLQHELGAKGVRIQAVLPGATATEIWDKAGLPVKNLPASVVMSPEDMVDAALVGLDQGELVTIPSLHDGDEWTRFEAARRALSKRFGNAVPAPRYRIGAPASADRGGRA